MGKKILVVEDISKALKLDNVRIVNDRAEAYAKKGNSFDFLTGRAVSNLPHFLTFSCDLLKNDSEAPNSGLLYVKGGHFLMKSTAQESKNTVYVSARYDKFGER